jgi:molybdopterin-containing oxidoreductase family iron-sulfur binding subunit
MTEQKSLDLTAIRQRLAQTKGRQFWRSLEELAETEEFQKYLQQEHPHWTLNLAAFDRRKFLKLMGASMALAGLTGCSGVLEPQPAEKILPYTRQPEQIIPGKPLFFATAMSLGGFATGLLAESHMGRPTKLEGNPDHPASLGSTDALTQASILELYDPERSQAVLKGGRFSSWTTFLEELEAVLAPQRANTGAGLRILTETVTSPSLAQQFEQLLEQFPLAQWHQYEPVHRDSARAGAELAFGQVVQPVYDFEQADIILTLDADIFAAGPGNVRYARDFAARRGGQAASETVNRFYAVESSPTPSGSLADHRLPLRATQIETFARRLANELGLDVEVGDESALDPHLNWLTAVAEDLQANEGRSLVVPGDYQSPAVHALAHAMNDLLGNVGNTVIYTDPIEADPVIQTESLQALVTDMAAGEVNVLIIIGGNPVYNAPADLDFATQLQQVDFRVHLGLYTNETSDLCQWHIPHTHFLEAWSDTRAHDGTVTIVQPLIAPLYENHSPHELLAVLLEQPASAHDVVRTYWEDEATGDDFEEFWQTTIHDGVMADTELAAGSVSLQASLDLPAPDGPLPSRPSATGRRPAVRPG